MSTISEIKTIRPVEQRFELSQSTKDELKSMKPNFGFNGLGEVVFRRTYSRGNEDWADVVIRVIQGVMSIRKEHYYRNSLEWSDENMQKYARNMAVSMFDMKWLPPGRGLWMMGTDFVYNRGSMGLFNCGAVDTKDDIVEAAEWTMDTLMNGVGIGYNTVWRGDIKRPDKKDSETFVVPDTREGWCYSLVKLMTSYIDSPRYGHGKYPIFDYSQVRAAGLPIRGFGGVSSGPEPLKKLHARVEKFLDYLCDGYIEVDGKKKNYNHTRFVADIFNSIGACVVAGNVRRSAQICLGDVNDETFMNLKNYEKNPERMDIGWMSNNSVVLQPGYDFENFRHIPSMAKRIVDNGEPGMINLYNIQKFGRYGKEMPDDATLVNPCGEINLGSFELCNLAETFPPRCNDSKEFYEAMEYATFYASTVALLPTHRPESNRILTKNRRIGISISGIAQWANGEIPSGWGSMNYTNMTRYLRDGYAHVREINTRLANSAGVPPSIRVTTVKPSGSISLLAGVTPGIHYPVSRYAIRRVRIGNDSPLVDVLKKSEVPCEPDTYSDNTTVFEFVIDHGNVRPCEEVSPWEQFSLVAMLQRFWADNNVSATIYFDKTQKNITTEVEKMLAMYIPQLKSVSMLPHSGHGYAQAPYEPIDEATYLQLKDSYNTPDFSLVENNVPVGSKYCSGDKCQF